MDSGDGTASMPFFPLVGLSEGTESRRLRLRYPAVCATCGIELSRGAEAVWNRAAKTATCLACAPGGETPDAGTAGASAAAEGERRKDRKVDDVRRRFGD